MKTKAKYFFQNFVIPFVDNQAPIEFLVASGLMLAIALVSPWVMRLLIMVLPKLFFLAAIVYLLLAVYRVFRVVRVEK